MARYFTGRDVESYTLTQEDATTFKELVQRTVNMPMRLNFTREKWCSMSEAEQKKAKLTAYLVPCTFPSSPWTQGRKLEHAQDCNLIFLDIDAKDDDCPAAPFVKEPQLLFDRLGDFNYAVYHTISSTPERPRLRVMVDAQGIPKDSYADAARTVGQLLGLPYVTRESGIAHQAMFRPSLFADQNVETEHPLLDTHFDGRPFTTADIATDLDSLPGMVSQGRMMTPSIRATGDPVEDWFRFLQLPMKEVTFGVVNEILGKVPADVPYFDWLNVAAALRHQFQDNESAAYEVFDTWSASGNKYAGPEDTKAKWKSLVAQPKGRAPVTARTLLKLGVEHGWDGRKVRAECYKSVTDWVMFHCKDGTELVQEAPMLIAAIHGLSSTEEHMLAATVVATLRQKFAMPGMTAAMVKKAVSRLREIDTHRKSENTKEVFPPWAQGWVYVASTNEFFRQSTGQKHNKDALNAVHSEFLLPSIEDLQNADMEVTQGSLHRPMFLPSDYLLNHVKCKKVDEYDYDPSHPEELITGQPGAMQFVNTYRKSYRGPDASLAGYAEEVIRDHLANLIAEPDYQRIVLDWMAYNVQNPGCKIRWAILLQGAEGNGKTTLINVMQEVLGSGNVRLINNETFKKGWSEWAFGSQVIGIEEIRAVGHSRHDMLNMLKEPITNDFITINKRGQDTRTLRSMTNYIALTNFHDALPLDENGRRWCVIKSALQTAQHVEELESSRPGYFDRLFDMLTTHGPGLRYMLENWSISPEFKPNGRAPITTYRSDMVADTDNEVQAAIKQIIEDGINPYVRHDVVASGSLRDALQFQDVSDVQPQYLASVLRASGYTKIKGKRPVIGGKAQYVWARMDLIKDRNPIDILNERGTLGATESDDWA